MRARKSACLCALACVSVACMLAVDMCAHTSEYAYMEVGMCFHMRTCRFYACVHE